MSTPRQHIVVMKFGGTSVEDSTAMLRTAAIVAGRAKKGLNPIVVVSAMSKVTDLLLDTTRMAEADDMAGIERNLEQLTARHLEAARDLIPAAELDRVNTEIADLVGEFRRIVNGMQMLGYRPVRAVDEAIAVGERLSALLVSEHLRSRGLAA